MGSPRRRAIGPRRKDGKLMLMTFNEWWEKDGRYIDPDTSDVDWYDKRKELAGIAFEAALNVNAEMTAERAEAAERIKDLLRILSGFNSLGFVGPDTLRLIKLAYDFVERTAR